MEVEENQESFLKVIFFFETFPGTIKVLMTIANGKLPLLAFASLERKKKRNKVQFILTTFHTKIDFF